VDRRVRRGDGTVAVTGPHYADNGPVGAPALIFVGSLGTTLAMWEPQIREFSSRFRTITAALPGHGKTPVPEARCTVTGFADDIVRLLDSIGVERFAIVGLSFGGAVAQALAAAYPDRVCAAVIACAAAQYSEEFWRTRAAHVRAEGLAEIVRLTAGRRFSPGFAEREPDTYAVSLAMLATMSPEGYAACCDALVTYDARTLLPRITTPTLVIAGELDQVTPPRCARWSRVRGCRRCCWSTPSSALPSRPDLEPTSARATSSHRTTWCGSASSTSPAPMTSPTPGSRWTPPTSRACRRRW
jgi:3-oxoadipate enol-lactonase